MVFGEGKYGTAACVLSFFGKGVSGLIELGVDAIPLPLQPGPIGLQAVDCPNSFFLLNGELGMGAA